ncbi:MAG: hypothetical protein FJ294_15380, partial [Planctomycetes bacterium]|nr:hypothetical protein [Planctomycetota bacterium]
MSRARIHSASASCERCERATRAGAGNESAGGEVEACSQRAMLAGGGAGALTRAGMAAENRERPWYREGASWRNPMLVPKQVTWWRLVFKYRGSELPRTKGRIIGVALVALVVTVLEERHDWHPNLTPLPFTLVGIALGIFLGFRNNASYDRWWEGRKLWGALVNTTRSFARQALTLVGPRASGAEDAQVVALRREIVLRIVAFVHALRMSLRDVNDVAELARFLPAEEVERLKSETNRPYAITQGTAERLRAAYD